MQRKKLPFVVAVPIPTRDRNGRPLPRKARSKAIAKVLKRFDELFGGAKEIASPGTYKARSGKTIVEEREPLVISMTTRRFYLRQKDEVEKLASQVGDELNQEAMAVVAFDSGEGVLLLMD